MTALKERKKTDPANYTNVALMIDAMSIRRQIIFDQVEQKLKGFVDLGDGSESEDEASEALVFMVVGYRGHWKAPIAYYLTKSLKKDTQKELIVHAMTALHEIGMRVWTITMDGHATNQSMCRALGCNMMPTDCIPFFKHPAEPDQTVYIIYDPCHMLKLFRNMLFSYGCFRSEKGMINSQYITKLQNLQEEAGLRLGNKLTIQHIQYMKKTMKVNLAAQTLSSSVASALKCLKEAGHQEFKEVDATVEFIEVSIL